MARRVAKCTMGIQDDGQNTCRRDVFQLAYRSKAVILAKVGLISYKVENHDENRNDEAMRLLLDQLDEVRATTKQRLARY